MKWGGSCCLSSSSLSSASTLMHLASSFIYDSESLGSHILLAECWIFLNVSECLGWKAFEIASKAQDSLFGLLERIGLKVQWDNSFLSCLFSCNCIFSSFAFNHPWLRSMKLTFAHLSNIWMGLDLDLADFFILLFWSLFIGDGLTVNDSSFWRGSSSTRERAWVLIGLEKVLSRIASIT